MNLKFGLYAFMLACSFFVQVGYAQVTNVKYQMRYNTTSCRYDCYLIIVAGTATTSQQRAQFNAQYSIVVPTGTSISVAQNFMPLQSNQTYTGTTPLRWILSSSVLAPAVEPQNDFHSITPTLSPAAFYNNLAAGDTIRLFSLAISPVTGCGSGIYIYRNGVDPGSSAAGMGGGDFSNGFTMGSPTQRYTGNIAQVNPPPPVLSTTTSCSGGVEIDLTATTSACQTPLTYVWAGPNGYAGTTQDVGINPSTLANAGLYTVTVTDARGCSATTSMTAATKPSAGADQLKCQNTSATLTGTQPTTGNWTAQGTNPAGSTLGSTSGGIATANFDNTASGDYKFIYTSGSCSDTMNVAVTVPNAGPDPQAVGCFSSGTASITATGSGTWTIGPGSAGTLNIANPISPTTTVSGFSVQGTYFLVWTVNGCTDIAQITVGNNCTCVILNNSVTPVSPPTYCGSSGNIIIDGAAASPPGGTYTWQYSFNNGAFASASGTINLEDYTTPNLATGAHRYRRIYFVPGSPACTDTSNVVLFSVNASPTVPTGLTATPNPVCTGTTVNLQATNNPGATYTWTASGPNAGLVGSSVNSTTMVPIAAGNYTISVTQSINGCPSAPATVNMVVNSVPNTPSALNTSSVNPSICGGNNGSISFSGLSPNTSFTINYTKNGFALFANVVSNGSGIATMSGQSAGTFTNLSITNATGCTSGLYAGPIELTDPNAPSAPAGLAAAPNPTCAGTVINLSVTNNPGAIYNWSVSPAGGLVSSVTNMTTMTPVLSGFYTVNVTQTVAGCTSVPAFIGISVNESPVTPTAGNVNAVNPTTCGGANGSISIGGLIAFTAYTIDFKKNTVPTTVNVTTNGSGVAIIINQTAGSYTDFKVSNISGCSSGIYAGPVNLIDPSAPAAPIGLIANPNPVCLGRTVTLAVTNNPGATYSWTASNANAGLVATATSSTTMVPLATGTFTISVTQSVSGCTSPAASVTVIVNPSPPNINAGNITSVNPTVCGGNSGSISISGLLNSTVYTFQYNKNGQPAFINVVTNGSGIALISNLTAGNYSDFVLTNASGCSSLPFIGPVILTDPNAPSPPSGLTANPNPICVGLTVTLSVTNNPGANYAWTASSANAGLVSASSNTTSMVPISAGTFTVSVTQSIAGCTSPAATVTVIVTAGPATPTAGNVTSVNPGVCGGTNGSISISGLVANSSYTIAYTRNGTPLTANVVSNGSGTVTITGLNSGNYSGFRITDSNGCASGTYNGITSLSDPGSPSAPAGISAIPNPVCIGTTVNLSVTNNPGAIYNWSASSPNAGLNIINSNATTMLAIATGPYTINVTQTVAGCTSPAASIVVNVNPIPPALSALNISGNNPTACGGSQGSFSLTGLPANTTYTLNYSKNGNPTTASITTSGTGNAAVTSLTAGNYTNFSLTGAGNCQSGVFSGPIVLTDPALPGAPSGISAVPNPVCLNAIVNLSVTNNPGAVYFWSASSAQAGLVASATATTTMTALAVGQYTISVTQSVNNCISPAATVIVNVNPLPPSPSAGTVSKTDPTSCLGTNGTVILSGYTANTNFTVNYNRNGSAQVANLSSNSNGQIIISGLNAGIYSDFRVINSSGCSSSIYTGSVQLSDPPAQGLPLNLTAIPNPACLGNTIQLSVTNEAGATFSWSASSNNAGLNPSASNTTTMLPTVAATYTVSVTKTVAGCLSPASSVTVVVNSIPATPNQNSFTTVNPTCGGSNGVISISGLIANEMYTIKYKYNNAPAIQNITTNSFGSAVLLGLSGGNYTDFIVTSAANCSSGVFAGPVVLTDPGLPPAPTGMIASPQQICIRSSVGITVNNNPSALYAWSVSDIGAGLQFSNTNTTMMMPTAPGFFTVSVTQTVNGCTSPPASIVLEVKPDCYNPDFDVTYVNFPLTGDVSTNDVPLTMKTYTNIAAVSGNPSSCIPVLSANGKYTFNCGVTGRYSYNVTVCNGISTTFCAGVPLVITVLQPLVNNNPPIANHDYIRTKTGAPIMLNLTINDRCQSASNCTLAAPTVVINPLNGSYNPSTMIYTPGAGFIGSDSIRYRICQNPVVTPVNCQEAWAYITVIGNNAPNVTNAMDDYGQTPLNTTLIVSAAKGLKMNDSDPEGDFQTITSMNVTIANRGTFVVQNDGSYNFTPITGYVGPVDCPYEVCDNNTNRACDIATVHILVEPSVPKGSVGNRVWHDINGDGLQSNGEPGIPGITVRLYSSGTFLLDTKQTDANGAYLFENVSAGRYYVQFAKPAQYEFIFADAGDDNLDSDVNGAKGVGTTSVFELMGGENNLSIDAGFYQCAVIGDRVWYDTNKNDMYDSQENGINGLRVYLWRFHLGVWRIWASTFTSTRPGSPSDDGYFSFCVAPGQYYVEVVMPPLGLVQVIAKRGSASTDSDLTNTFGQGTTASFMLNSGQSKLDIGAGFYPMAVAGNLVWLDINQNGAQESSEPKISGVKVQIYDATSHIMVKEAVTNVNGEYNIDYLQKQDVYLKFNIPSQYSATIPRATSQDLDSDVDHSYGPNTTRKISLLPGDNNNSIDLGVMFGVLPVDWVYVNAIRTNGKHVIKWGTAREVNLSHYELERKIGVKGDFVSFGLKIMPNKSGTSVHDYEGIDDDADLPGTYYYRVKQVDFDGKFTYSDVVYVTFIDESAVVLYPSPSVNEANLDINLGSASKVSIKLFDAASKLITVISDRVMEEGSHNIRIDLTGITAGVYNILLDINGERVTKKLIKVD